MTLKLNLNQPINGQYLFKNISIDIVPCIHVDGWWPDGALSNLSYNLKVDGCNLVFDQPQRKYPWVLYSQPYARISFAPAESRIIAKAPRVARAAYMVAKQLMKFEREQTYVLKTCFLYCLEALNNYYELHNNVDELVESERYNVGRENVYEEIEEVELSLWVERLFLCYLEFCIYDCFPCYLMPNFIFPFYKESKISRIVLYRDYLDRCLNTATVCRNLFWSESELRVLIPPRQPMDRAQLIRKLSSHLTLELFPKYYGLMDGLIAWNADVH